MWYIIAIIAIVMIGGKLDKILKEMKMKNPEYRKEEEERYHESVQEKKMLHGLLKESKGKKVCIVSDRLYLAGLGTSVEGTVLQTCNGWIEFEIQKKKKVLYMDMEDISEVTVLK